MLKIKIQERVGEIMDPLQVIYCGFDFFAKLGGFIDVVKKFADRLIEGITL